MMFSWTWKYFLFVMLFILLVVTLLLNFKTQFLNLKRTSSNDIELECLEPSGESLLICYITNKNIELLKDCCASVNKISSINKNLSVNEIIVWEDLEIHSYNFPEHMIANLGQFFKYIERFTIHNSKLKFLYRSCFTSIASQLVYLDLHHNEIEIIPSDTFDDLLNLVFLQLSGNKITHLSSSSFIRNLNKLHTFSANSNKISKIDQNFFSNSNHFLNIKWIYLAGNKIKNICINLLQFKNLKAVDLRNNFNNCSILFNVHENKYNKTNVLGKYQEKINANCKKTSECF